MKDVCKGGKLVGDLRTACARSKNTLRSNIKLRPDGSIGNRSDLMLDPKQFFDLASPQPT
jgi:hypothetical protein